MNFEAITEDFFEPSMLKSTALGPSSESNGIASHHAKGKSINHNSRQVMHNRTSRDQSQVSKSSDEKNESVHLFNDMRQINNAIQHNSRSLSQKQVYKRSARQALGEKIYKKVRLLDIWAQISCSSLTKQCMELKVDIKIVVQQLASIEDLYWELRHIVEIEMADPENDNDDDGENALEKKNDVDLDSTF